MSRVNRMNTSFFVCFLKEEKKSETRMTASVLKQNTNK